MNSYLVSTKEKKNVNEVEVWVDQSDPSKEATRTEVFRWGEWLIKLDNDDEISAQNEDGINVSSFEGELVNLDDSCEVIWEFTDNISEAEREEITSARDNDNHEGIENLGWELSDCDTWFFGPLDIELSE